MREAERTTLLRSVDEGWVEHITAMDDLRGSIGLRAYAQVSPIVAYRREGSDMFAEMVDNIRENTAKRMLAFNPEAELTRLDFSKIIIDGAAAARTPQRSVYGNLATPQKSSPSAPVRVTKVGRNDPCPCGSGKKYKKCCGLSDADAE